jgi:hypothetical protein
MTHTIYSMHFGAAPTTLKYHMLRRLHPLGLNKNWLDKLQGQNFFSESPQHTHEHYLQVTVPASAATATSTVQAGYRYNRVPVCIKVWLL